MLKTLTLCACLLPTAATAQYRLQQPLQPPPMVFPQQQQAPVIVDQLPMQPLQMAPLQFDHGHDSPPQHCRMIRRRGGYNEGDETVSIDCY